MTEAKTNPKEHFKKLLRGAGINVHTFTYLDYFINVHQNKIARTKVADVELVQLIAAHLTDGEYTLANYHRRGGIENTMRDEIPEFLLEEGKTESKAEKLAVPIDPLVYTAPVVLPARIKLWMEQHPNTRYVKEPHLVLLKGYRASDAKAIDAYVKTWLLSLEDDDFGTPEQDTETGLWSVALNAWHIDDLFRELYAHFPNTTLRWDEVYVPRVMLTY
ncbi:Hypothetical protein POVN_LOCUS500 [uncultured virus]|nr:Hypothetical protein POVN_LOCUS500 [uncultured virus]